MHHIFFSFFHYNLIRNPGPKDLAMWSPRGSEYVKQMSLPTVGFLHTQNKMQRKSWNGYDHPRYLVEAIQRQYYRAFKKNMPPHLGLFLTDCYWLVSWLWLLPMTVCDIWKSSRNFFCCCCCNALYNTKGRLNFNKFRIKVFSNPGSYFRWHFTTWERLQ